MKNQIAVSCFGVLLALLVVELSVRGFLSAAPVRPRADRPHRYYVATDHRFELELIEQQQKKADTFRVAAVGDSFTFGPALQQDDTYSKHLERLLNLQRSIRHVEVFNLGVPGYSTHHEVDSVRAALRGKADLVTLSITLNDPQLVSLQLESEEVWHQFGKYQPSPAAQRVFALWKTAGFVAERLHNNRSIKAYVDYHKHLFEDPLSWGRFTAALQKMKSETDKAGVPFFVMTFPLLDFPLDKNYPFAEIHKKIDEFLRAEKIPHVDLLPAFRGMDNQRLQILPGRDSHPNEIAHRIAAERLFSALLSSHMVPDEFRPQFYYPTRDDPRRMHVQHLNYRDRAQAAN